MKKNNYYNIAEWAVRYALKSGATEAAAFIGSTKNLNISLINDEIEKLQESNQNSLDISLYCNNKYSSHSTNDLRKESLEKFIDEAVKMTNYLAKDEARTLPEKKYYPDAGILNINLDISDSSYNGIDFKDKLGLLNSSYGSIKGKSEKIISIGSYYNDTLSKGVRIHSNGFGGDYERTTFSVYVTVSVNDPNGGKPAGGEGCVARYFNEIKTPEVLAGKALDRALNKIGQKKIDSGVYKMLVENQVGWGVTGKLFGAMGGRALQQKNSYLEGMLGKKITSEKLTIIDDPFIKRGLSSRHFDNEGLAAQKKEVISDGVLNYFYIDNYYGKKLNMEPYTGNSSNLLYNYGNKSLDDMLRMIDKGIFVTDFIGGNFNSTTGDYSNGIAGFYVENGEIKFPVNEMNISGNAKDLWANLLEIGNDPYKYSSNQTPCFLFDKIDFSGK